MNQVRQLHETGAGEPARAQAIASGHFGRLQEVLGAVDLDALEQVVERLRRARDEQGTVFIAGNGGSAATASHWANDLGKATKRSGCGAIRVMCLSDNASWLTALANDEGYERAFSGQLENFAREGDVLVVISASGNSPNLVNAVGVAHAAGVDTIGLLGFDGGALGEIVHRPLVLATESGAYELVEDGHGALCHAVTICLTKDSPDGNPLRS